MSVISWHFPFYRLSALIKCFPFIMYYCYVVDLEEAVQPLSIAYQSSVKNLGVSVADFWAKCGQVASEAGRRNACKNYPVWVFNDVHVDTHGIGHFNNKLQ